MDGYGNWNDQRSDNVPFITEFELPLIRYKQISGPANGSAEPVGTYEVCYEKVNTITDQKETTCFNVQVVCNSAASTGTTNSAANALERNISSATSGGLSISSSPNPSSRYFKIKVTSSQPSTKLDLVVMDIAGKVVKIKNDFCPTRQLRLARTTNPVFISRRLTRVAIK